MTNTVALSIVIPVYGCRACLADLCQQIEQSVADIKGGHEILLIDDRSPDDAWAEIERLAAIHSSIRAVRLSRNFGQHIAISAGLAEARGDRVAVMDCDLQDPPALLRQLMTRMDEGVEIVLTRRQSRSHSIFRRAATHGYFHFLALLIGQKIDPLSGSYSLLSRKVVDAYVRFGERERHYLFIVRWLGFSVGHVDYRHQPRAHGRSSYSWRRLVSHSIDGVLFQSTRLLRWIVALGMCFAVTGLLLATYLIWRVMFHTALPGWTSLAVLILICTGAILVSLGVIGTYVAKIFAQTKARPLYVVDERLGFEA